MPRASDTNVVLNLISVVVPTHNERENVAVFYERLAAVFGMVIGFDFELIFCDDSSDDTPEQVKALCSRDRRVKLIRLSRRFSQAIAITAGLNRSHGGAVIIMDADLQDAPETIPSMIELWKNGYEIVYAQRQSESDYWLYRSLAKAFYRILRKVSAVDIPVDAGEFRLLDASVVRFLSELTEHTRFLRGLSVWPGLRQAKIETVRQPRSSGRTNYNFMRS